MKITATRGEIFFELSEKEYEGGLRVRMFGEMLTDKFEVRGIEMDKIVTTDISEEMQEEITNLLKNWGHKDVKKTFL